jgi:hypothetical protein
LVLLLSHDDTHYKLVKLDAKKLPADKDFNVLRYKQPSSGYYLGITRLSLIFRLRSSHENRQMVQRNVQGCVFPLMHHLVVWRTDASRIRRLSPAAIIIMHWIHYAVGYTLWIQNSH